MSAITSAAIQVVLSLVLLGSLVVQFAMVPLLAQDLEGLNAHYAYLRIPILVFLVLFVLAVEVACACVWKLVRMVRKKTVFSTTSFRFVNAVIVAVTSASVLVFALGFLFAPGEAVPPGIVLLIGGAGLLISGVALIVYVLRALLAQAIARDAQATSLQAELNEVI